MTAFSDVKLDTVALALIYEFLGFFQVFRSVGGDDSEVSEKLINIVNDSLIAIKREEIKKFFVRQNRCEVKFAVGESTGTANTHHSFDRFSFFYRITLFDDENFFVFLFRVFVGGKETGRAGTQDDKVVVFATGHKVNCTRKKSLWKVLGMV